MARDILYGDNNELRIQNGDFVSGISDGQHVEDILLSHKGHFKQFPMIGVGIHHYINSPDSAINRDKMLKEIKLQLESDNAQNVDVLIDQIGQLKISCEYAE